MRTRNVLTSFAFIMLTLFLILIIASRTSEAGGINLSGEAGTGAGQPRRRHQHPRRHADAGAHRAAHGVQAGRGHNELGVHPR